MTVSMYPGSKSSVFEKTRVRVWPASAATVTTSSETSCFVRGVDVLLAATSKHVKLTGPYSGITL